MGDEGFDPCECLWGHELAMRRLLSLLRQSQAYCTDAECFETVARPQSQGGDNPFIYMILMMAFILLMFYMRPRSQTSRLLEGPSKPANNDNDSNGFPPTPPTAS